jgi:hypothetical protein
MNGINLYYKIYYPPTAQIAHILLYSHVCQINQDSIRMATEWKNISNLTDTLRNMESLFKNIVKPINIITNSTSSHM